MIRVQAAILVSGSFDLAQASASRSCCAAAGETTSVITLNTITTSGQTFRSHDMAVSAITLMKSRRRMTSPEAQGHANIGLQSSRSNQEISISEMGSNR